MILESQTNRIKTTSTAFSNKIHKAALPTDREEDQQGASVIELGVTNVRVTSTRTSKSFMR